MFYRSSPPASAIVPTLTPEELEAAKAELANIRSAVIVLMVDNGLARLPNPVTSPTDDMSAFPDSSVAGSANKLKDGSGNTYQSGDKNGYVLYQHDMTADNSQTNPVNYIATRFTKGTYIVDLAGTVTQVTYLTKASSLVPAPTSAPASRSALIEVHNSDLVLALVVGFPYPNAPNLVESEDQQ